MIHHWPLSVVFADPDFAGSTPASTDDRGRGRDDRGRDDRGRDDRGRDDRGRDDRGRDDRGRDDRGRDDDRRGRRYRDEDE